MTQRAKFSQGWPVEITRGNRAGRQGVVAEVRNNGVVIVEIGGRRVSLRTGSLRVVTW